MTITGAINVGDRFIMRGTHLVEVRDWASTPRGAFYDVVGVGWRYRQVMHEGDFFEQMTGRAKPFTLAAARRGVARALRALAE